MRGEAWKGGGGMAQFIGRVIGTKMQKTAKVEVTRMFLHPQVLKVSDYLVHLNPHQVNWLKSQDFLFVYPCSISASARPSLLTMRMSNVALGTWS